MGAVRDAFNSAFRDWNTFGVPASGANDPAKAEIRNIGSVIEQLIVSGGIGDTIYETTAAGIAATDDGQLFLVKGSGAPSFADLYKNVADAAVNQNVSIPSSEYVDSYGLKAANYDGATLPVLRNLFDKEKVTPNAGINGATGVTYFASGISLTGAIPVGGIPQVTVNVDLYKYAFYNFAGQFVSGDDGVGDVVLDAGDPLTIPDGVFYLRFDTPAGFVAGLMVVPGVSTPSSYLPFAGSSATLSNPWASKSAGFVGDSITAVHVYQPLVTGMLGASFAQFTNDGVSGRKMGECIPVLTGANLDALDILGVWLGTNDFGGNRPLGVYGDATGAGTFYGDVRNVIETALSENPLLQMFMVTPMKRGVVGGMPAWNAPNSAGHVLADYADAIIRVAADYAVPVLDMFRLSGFNDLTLPTYASDLLHPSTTPAWEMIARKFAAFIRSI